MKKIILIGGAPTTGKSTMAKRLGQHLGLPWIGADYLRTVIKQVGRAEDFPQTLSITDHTAESYWAEHTPVSAVESENKESKEMWKVVKALLTSNYEGIIEGITITPELVQEVLDVEGVQVIFLVDQDEDRIRHVAYTRGVWGDADSYTDDVKEKEVEWVLEYNKWIIEEAKKYNSLTVEITKGENDLQKVLAVLN